VLLLAKCTVGITKAAPRLLSTQQHQIAVFTTAFPFMIRHLKEIIHHLIF